MEKRRYEKREKSRERANRIWHRLVCGRSAGSPLFCSGVPGGKAMEVAASLPVSSDYRILLSRLRHNTCDNCIAARRFCRVILVSSGCPVWCSGWRVVPSQPDGRKNIPPPHPDWNAAAGYLFVDCAGSDTASDSDKKCGASGISYRPAGVCRLLRPFVMKGIEASVVRDNKCG